MSDGGPSQLRRASRTRRTADGIDGGAIAIGLVVPLSVFAPTMVLSLSSWVTALVLIVGVFLGGFLTASLAADRAQCPPCHGGAMAGVFAVIVGLVGLANTLAAGEGIAFAVGDVVGTDPITITAGVGAALVVGAAGAVVAELGEAPTRTA